jgi:hypothetical protein
LARRVNSARPSCRASTVGFPYYRSDGTSPPGLRTTRVIGSRTNFPFVGATGGSHGRTSRPPGLPRIEFTTTRSPPLTWTLETSTVQARNPAKPPTKKLRIAALPRSGTSMFGLRNLASSAYCSWIVSIFRPVSRAMIWRAFALLAASPVHLIRLRATGGLAGRRPTGGRHAAGMPPVQEVAPNGPWRLWTKTRRSQPSPGGRGAWTRVIERREEDPRRGGYPHQLGGGGLPIIVKWNMNAQSLSRTSPIAEPWKSALG